jgi:hypothetical protein
VTAETDHFIREPFGWVCKRCRDAQPSATAADKKSVRDPLREGRARFFHEGEAGERASELSAPALARWREGDEGKTLFCPNCDAQESV